MCGMYYELVVYLTAFMLCTVVNVLVCENIKCCVFSCPMMSSSGNVNITMHVCSGYAHVVGYMIGIAIL